MALTHRTDSRRKMRGYRRGGSRPARLRIFCFPDNRNQIGRRFGGDLGGLLRQPGNLHTQVLDARRCHSGTDTRHLGRGFFPRRARRQQIAPDVDRVFGLLKVFTEAWLAVKAPPPSGFEKFGQILQALLGKRAPARNDVSPACDIEWIGHEPARKRKKRGRNRDESLRHGRYILWKTLPKSTARHYWTSAIN